MANRETMVFTFTMILVAASVGTYSYYSFFRTEADRGEVQKTIEKSAIGQETQTPASQTPHKDIRVQGNTTQTTNPQTSTPTPEQFSDYEKYSTKQSTLYIDTEQGTGNEAVSGKTVSVLYKGWLTDGTLFDQTKPDSNGTLRTFNFTLGANRVIQGWEQGIPGMKEGGTRRLIIPPQLGYGPVGSGDTIPPHSMLIFDVTLVKVHE